jgi:hypothetical protein
VRTVLLPTNPQSPIPKSAIRRRLTQAQAVDVFRRWNDLGSELRDLGTARQ